MNMLTHELINAQHQMNKKLNLKCYQIWNNIFLNAELRLNIQIKLNYALLRWIEKSQYIFLTQYGKIEENIEYLGYVDLVYNK